MRSGKEAGDGMNRSELIPLSRRTAALVGGAVAEGVGRG